MTYDRGSEMACHPELARRLKIDIWFCDPHAPLSADCDVLEARRWRDAIACLTMRGSTARTKTPTDCCASCSRKELI